MWPYLFKNLPVDFSDTVTIPAPDTETSVSGLFDGSFFKFQTLVDHYI